MIITVGRRCQKTVFELHIIAVIHSHAAWNLFFKLGGIMLKFQFPDGVMDVQGESEVSNSAAGYLDFTEAGAIE